MVFAALPTGGILPEHAWRRRHRGITILLGVHTIAIAVYAVLRGFSAGHAMVEALIPLLAFVVSMATILPNRKRMAVASFGLLTCSALLVHLSGGLVEMHFHFFVMIAVVALYQDWLPFLIAVAFVLVHHAVIGVLDPTAVYNHSAAINRPWLFALVHSAFVGAESVACLVSWRLNEQHLLAAGLAEGQLVEEITRITDLNRVADKLAAGLDADDVGQLVADVAADMVAADASLFIYRSRDDAGEERWLFTRAGGSGAQFEAPQAHGDLARRVLQLKTGIALRVVDDPEIGPISLPPPDPPGSIVARSILAVPVGSPVGPPLGALIFLDREPVHFSEADARSAIGMATHAGVAIDNSRLYSTQRDAALTLQRGLLPDRLPSIDGLELAATYLPGGPGCDVGGDWYDAFRTPDGGLAMIMGDVVGKGLPAASLMGQLRNALRAYVLEGHGPAEALNHLNDVARSMGLGYVATVVLTMLDARTGLLRIANAGHLPPLLIGQNGSARYLDTPPGVPPGVLENPEYAETSIEIPEASTLVFYTDGVVESRTSSLDVGLDRLRIAAASSPTAPKEMCAYLLETCERHGSPDDDRAIMVVARQRIGGSRIDRLTHAGSRIAGAGALHDPT